MSQTMNPKGYKNKIGLLTPKKIGSGSYSKVYESSKDFAVKVQPTYDGVYIREIAILRYLNHPNIIKPEGYLFVNYTDEIHIAMQKAESTLVALIDSVPDIQTITSISYQLLHALAYMEEKNIIHRDLKPGNILMYGNTVKICDFGLSKYFIDGKNSHTSHTSEVQTLWYRSPEVTFKQGYNFKTDVWSIGAIILEMAGNNLFKAQRYGYMEDAKDNNSNSTNDPKFIIKWFSYLLGAIPQEAKWSENLPEEWLRKKSSLHKLCRFTGYPLINLVFKLLAWIPEDRPSAREALEHKCFEGNTVNDTPKEIKEQSFEWYNQKKSLQTMIGIRHREILFGWIWELSRDYKLSYQTPVLAFALIDLFMSRRNISVTQLQLVGLACLSIVEKVHEVEMHTYKEWVYMTDNAYKARELSKMEELILHEFNFDFMRIFHQILTYRLDRESWCIVSCLLCTDNPGSIDSILSKSVEEKRKLISLFQGSYKLKEMCLEVLSKE